MDATNSNPASVTSSPTPHVQVIQKGDDTAKTILIVIVTILVLCFCCIVMCFVTSFGSAILGTLGLGSAVSQIQESEEFDVALKDYVEIDDNYVLTLTVKNEGKTAKTFSPFIYLRLEDEFGVELFENFLFIIPDDESFSDNSIKPGESFIGKVAYKILGNPKGLTLEVKSNIFDSTPTFIKVK